MTGVPVKSTPKESRGSATVSHSTLVSSMHAILNPPPTVLTLVGPQEAASTSYGGER